MQAALVEQLPAAQVASHKVWLAAFRNSLADLLLARDQCDEAKTLAEQTISSLTALLQANPDMWYLHALLADSDRMRSTALRRTGHSAEADAAQRSEEQHRRAQRAAQPGPQATTRPE